MTFEDLELHRDILRAVSASGYKVATPIQQKAIPAILNGKDVLGGAQTGTGKTAAFALPVLHLLCHSSVKGKYPGALVITPTRELADQVGESFRTYGKNLPLSIAKIYGGIKIQRQISTLKNGADIVIATPGRLLDHLNQKTINLSEVKILVLDEADRMLDMGFINDIKKIIKFLPLKRQNLLFSATYSREIRNLAAGILHDPISIEVSERNTAAENVEQKVYFIDKEKRKDFLAHLIKTNSWKQVLVFVKMKHGANRLSHQLNRIGITSLPIHGDKSQGARTRALNQFKTGEIQVLVATDVAARGLQIDNLDIIVNYELPQVPEDYIHRIGRTGRAGKAGSALSLVSPDETNRLDRIEKLLKYPIAVGEVGHFDIIKSVLPDKPVPVRVKPDRKRYLANSSRSRKR
jgi:ATP-dependent RNA helicase RhlE